MKRIILVTMVILGCLSTIAVSQDPFQEEKDKIRGLQVPSEEEFIKDKMIEGYKYYIRPVEGFTSNYGIIYEPYEFDIKVHYIFGEDDKYKNKYFRKNYIDHHYTMAYWNDKGNAHVYIFPCMRSDHLNQILLIYYVYKSKIYENLNKKSDDPLAKAIVQVQSINNKNILHLSSVTSRSYMETVSWPSKNIIVYIEIQKISIEDNSNLVKAYLNKYPPTWDITESYLDPEKALRRESLRFLEMIEEQEKNRESSDKLEVFVAMNYQCEWEADIRYWTGETGKGCPVTMEMCEEKRIKGWQDYRIKISDAKIDVNNLSWDNIYMNKCQLDRQEFVIAEKLNLSLDKIPMKYLQP